MDESHFFLTDDSIRFHICALKKIANADGDYSESEKQFIEQTAQIYCCSVPELDVNQLMEATISEEDFDKSLSIVGSVPSRARMLLKDLISLGHVDGDYSDPEKKLVREIGSKLNIPEGAIVKLESAVENLIQATITLNNVIFA